MTGALRPSSAESVTLSVMLKTRNHERFVADALEGALAQQTTFPFEIVVGEDDSSDGTAAVVDAYARRRPDVIRVLHRPARVGMVRNTMDLYVASRGRYLAWLDGDDYWTSPDKLQKQVRVLDAHPELTMCFHEAEAVDRSGRRWIWSSTLPRRDRYTIEDLLVMPPGVTSSCLYRKVLTGFPDWFSGLSFSDWPLQILHAAVGPAVVLREVLGVYRVHHAGAASLGFDPNRPTLEAEFWAPHHAALYEILRRHFDHRYDAIIDAEVLRLHRDGASLRRATERMPALRRFVWRVVRRQPRAAAWMVAIAGRLADQLGRRVASPSRRDEQPPSEET
jgi:glycosyltransferase involved in cell wall biosynthesis